MNWTFNVISSSVITSTGLIIIWFCTKACSCQTSQANYIFKGNDQQQPSWFSHDKFPLNCSKNGYVWDFLALEMQHHKRGFQCWACFQREENTFTHSQPWSYFLCVVMSSSSLLSQQKVGFRFLAEEEYCLLNFVKVLSKWYICPHNEKFIYLVKNEFLYQVSHAHMLYVKGK